MSIKYLPKVSRLENSSSQLEELKRLLLEPELEQLKKLSVALEEIDFRLENQEEIVKRVSPLLHTILLQNLEAKDKKTVTLLSEYLSQIIEEASKAHLPALSASLQRVIAPAISKEIANNQDVMIDALYPIMGGMISKYVTQAIKELMEHINKKIERGLSVARFKRKVKAKLSGVSETELLLEESSDAIISELFIIHKESGLLVASASLDTQEIDDPYMVASMASAIKDFINDWINQQAHHESREEVQILSYGNATLYIESAGSVYLIAFLNHEPDYELRSKINTFFASLVKEYALYFQTFNGDDSTKEVSTLREMMKAYLLHQERLENPSTQKKGVNPVKSIFFVLLLGMILYGAYTGREWYRFKQLEKRIFEKTAEHITLSQEKEGIRLQGYINRVEKMKKIEEMVKEVTHQKVMNHTHLSLEGLHTLLAQERQKNTHALKVLQKAFSIQSATLEKKIDTLTQKLSLMATLNKSDENRRMLEEIEQKLVLFEHRQQNIHQLLHLKEAITTNLLRVMQGDPLYQKESQTLDFAPLTLFGAGKTTYTPEAIQKAGISFQHYIEALLPYRPYLSKIIIEGHSDSSGNSRENLRITKQRAEAIKEYFLSLPIIKKYQIESLLETEGKGDTELVLHYGIEDKEASRRVTVRFELKPEALLNAIGKVLNGEKE